MDEMTYFRKNALLADLCKDWNGRWMACHNDKEKLMRLVLMQQSAPYFADFCYRGKGLTKEYCKREFKDFINGRIFNDCDNVDGYTYAMYIDAQKGIEMKSDVTQFLWCKDMDVVIKETKCPVLYISNNSTINLTCEGFNSPKIYLFDKSKVILRDMDATCNVTILKYSDKAKVVIGKYAIGKVKEFNKTLRL